MNAPLAFVDCETTGLHPGRRAWEVAIIRCESDGAETKEWLAQITDVDLSEADPFGLKVGRFYERHALYADPSVGPAPDDIYAEANVAVYVERLTRGAHLVGAVPNFDAEVFADMLRRHKLTPAWHYHLIDIEAMAVGYLNGLRAYAAAQASADGNHLFDTGPIKPPWKSDDLSRAIGVEPPGDDERHTALGDARWAQRLYNRMTAPVPRSS